MTGIILAAGSGTRLGGNIPKGLLKLPTGETILERQVRSMRLVGIDDIVIVVGFKRELIQSAVPNVQYRHNQRFADTNTAKSLLLGLEGINDDVLWCNGDVVFDEEVLPLMIAQTTSAMVVNSEKCGAEEVKYNADSEGIIKKISKELSNGQGEALGVNIVRGKNVADLVKALRQCSDSDYFEAGIQLTINTGTIFKVQSVGNNNCIEIDFPEDWDRAISMFSSD